MEYFKVATFYNSDEPSLSIESSETLGSMTKHANNYIGEGFFLVIGTTTEADWLGWTTGLVDGIEFDVELTTEEQSTLNSMLVSIGGI